MFQPAFFDTKKRSVYQDMLGTSIGKELRQMGVGCCRRSDTLPQKHAHQKYGYVISCQIYGAYTREKVNKARMAKVQQIKDLLRLFPHLRIAYTVRTRTHFSSSSFFFFFLFFVFVFVFFFFFSSSWIFKNARKQKVNL